jgi:hypothetical protein
MTRLTFALLLGIALLLSAVARHPAVAQQLRLLPLSGPIQGPQRAAGSDVSCGGGVYAITRSMDLQSITRVEVEGFRAGDDVFSGSGTFPPGAAPIDPERGLFEVYFPGRLPGQEITVSGQFVLGPAYDPEFALGGISFSVSPSMCAKLGLGPPAPGGRLPDTGQSHGRSGESTLLWLGVAATAVGSALVIASMRKLRRSRRL